MRVFLRRLLIALAVIAAWQIICSLGLVSPLIVASPLAIVHAATTVGLDFLQAFQLTVMEIISAVALAWVLGISVGTLLGIWYMPAVVAGPLLSSAFAIPFIVWYPLMLIWLGLGPQSKIAYGVAIGFFPIAINTLSAVQHLDRRYLMLARSLGASGGQLFWKFILPSVMPSVVSGLRIGTSFCVIGVLVAEMIASVDGLGFWISYYRTLYDTGHVYLGILLALACTILANVGLSYIERRASRWRTQDRSAS